MDANKTFSSGQNTTSDTWYVDNYILLKECLFLLSHLNSTAALKSKLYQWHFKDKEVEIR